jgi:Tfp pilus assembly protein PilF
VGDIHLRNNDTARAKAEYERALEANPGNARATLGMAHCLRLEGQEDAALELYQAVIASAPDIPEAYSSAVRLLLRLERSDEAETLAAQFAQVDRARGGIVHAGVMRAAGRGAEALALLESLRGELGESVAVRIALAFSYWDSDQAARAESELRDVVTNLDPNSTAARMALVEVLRRQGRLADVETELRVAAEEADQQWVASPDDSSLKVRLTQARLLWALALLENGKAEEALAIAQPIVTESPDLPWGNYVYGSALLAQGQYRDAVQALQAAAAELPEEPLVTRRLALARGEGRLPGAAGGDDNVQMASAPVASVSGGSARSEPWAVLWEEANLQQLLLSRSTFDAKDDPYFGEMLVLAALFTGNRPLLDELVADLDDNSPLRALVGALQRGDVQGLRAVLDGWKEEDSVRAVMRANAEGYVYSALGVRGRALQKYLETAQTWPNNVVAYYNISAMYNSVGMHSFAARSLDRLLQQYPSSAEGRLLLYRTLRLAGMLNEARTAAETSYGIAPTNQNAILDLAEVYLDLGEWDLAVLVLRRGVEALPESPATASALVSGLLIMGDLEGAQAALADYAAGGGAGDLSALEAYCAATAGDWETATAKAATLSGADLSKANEYLVAATLFHAGQLEEGRAVLTQDGGGSGYLLAQALGDKAENLGEAADFVEAMRGKGEVLADFALALSGFESGLYNPAYSALVRVEQAVGLQLPLVSLMYSALAPVKAGPDRIARAEALSQRQPKGALGWVGLAAVYERAGETAKQGVALEQGLLESPNESAAWLAMATYWSRHGNADRAMEAYSKLIDMDAADARVYNNYAYYLIGAGGRGEEALKYAQLAATARANDPHIIHTLGLAQLETERVGEAQQNLIRALEMLPGDPTLMFDVGRSFMAMGQDDEGREYIRRAMLNADQLRLDFPRRAEAEQILAGG